MSDAAQYPSNGNGNGFSTKDVLVRLETKVDAFIDTQSAINDRMSRSLEELRVTVVTHELQPGHPQEMTRVMAMEEKVSELQRDEIRRDSRSEGRADVLRLIFGTSMAGLLAGMGGLVLGLLRYLEGN